VSKLLLEEREKSGNFYLGQQARDEEKSARAAEKRKEAA